MSWGDALRHLPVSFGGLTHPTLLVQRVQDIAFLVIGLKAGNNP